MESVKVLFVSQEITPYLPETPMSVLSRNLPQQIQEKGREIRTFMPKFGCVNERRNQLHEVIRLSGMNLIINDTDHPLIIKVASIQSARMQVYFIDNEEFFHRKATLLDEKNADFPDNDERSIFFCRGVLETVKKLRWSPDIIHCHGWFTGLIPILIKKSYFDDPLFAHSKIVTSLYDTEFKENLSSNFHEKMKFEGIENEDVEIAKDPTYNNFMKIAVNFSDGVIFGSQTINSELEKYVKTKKIPTLSFQNDDYAEAYNQFYNQVLQNN